MPRNSYLVQYENACRNIPHEHQRPSDISSRCQDSHYQARQTCGAVHHYFTQEEVRQLFKVIRSKCDKAIFLVAYRHGLWASEIGLLQRVDVDAKQGRISIHRLKGSLSSVYPVQPDVLKVARSYLRPRTDESPYVFVSNRNVPISRFMLHHLMQAYVELEELPVGKRKFHCLKHSIATHLLDTGAGLAFMKD